MLRRAGNADLEAQVAALKASHDAQKCLIETLVTRVEKLESRLKSACDDQHAQVLNSSVLNSSVCTTAGVLQPSRPASAVSLGGGGQPCARCGRVVYAAEQIVARGNIMHRECFRCAHCDGKLINSPTWEVLNGSFYCGPHFQQRVARGVAIEREPNANQLQLMIERKLRDAQEALQRDEERMVSKLAPANLSHPKESGDLH